MRKSSASERPDGAKSKELLLDTAGRLAAEKGWDSVTSREIAQEASLNLASINYWFGSRDGLYEAVIKSLPESILSEDFFMRLAEREPNDESLREFITAIFSFRKRHHGWAVKLWFREISGNPSPAFLRIAKGQGFNRLATFKRFIARYLGAPEDDLRVQWVVLSMMSLFLMTTVGSGRLGKTLLPEFFSDPKSAQQRIIESALLSLKGQRNFIAANKR